MLTRLSIRLLAIFAVLASLGSPGRPRPGAGVSLLFLVFM